jgi:hypothetical protein
VGPPLGTLISGLVALVVPIRAQYVPDFIVIGCYHVLLAGLA